MARTEFTRKTKREALERSGYRCEAAGTRYGFREGQRCNCDLRLGVIFDHNVPDQLGGDNGLDNCVSICVTCNKFKTANDIRQIRKSDRQRDKNSRVIRPKGTIKSQGFPSFAKGKQDSRHSWAQPLPKSGIEFAPKEKS